jgi:uncharacterized protein YbjT (DUF2867 family)
MILITGGTGTVGSEVVKQLAARGTKFRMLVRDPRKAFKHANVELVQGDLGNQAVLASALRGVDRLFLLTPSFPGSSELHKQVIDAAAKLGVGHTVRLSVIGADANSPIALARWHAAGDSYLQSSSVKWTLLRPTSFMQNFLASAPTIKKDRAFYGAAKNGKVPFIDARDIAGVAVKALTEPGHEGQLYTLTGKEPLSYAEAAAKFTQTLGKPVKYVDLAPEQFIAGLLGAGIPEWLAKDYAALHEVYASGQAATVDPTLGKLLGSVRSFDDFLAASANAFK